MIPTHHQEVSLLRRIWKHITIQLGIDATIFRLGIQRERTILAGQRVWWRILSQVLAVSFVLIVGYLVATQGLQVAAGANLQEALWRTMWLPLLILQILTSILAFLMGSAVVTGERRRQTWDDIRVTDRGIALTLRVRWMLVLYRLRFLIGLIVVGRLLLALLVLYEMTAFRGTYLDLVTANIIPVVPTWVGGLALAASLMAALLLPIVHISADVVLGLMVSIWQRNGGQLSVLQFLLIALRLITIIAPLLIFQAYFAGLLPPLGAYDDGIAWGLFALASGLGDWGLYHLQFTTLSTIWALIPHSIWVGLLMAGVVIVLSIIIDGLMAWAERSAERHE